ncbi:MAG TPA: hypothetical protein PKU77_08265 [Ferruginibacter sp.]|nr:hypothetical protein [Ferruginibacter sp.]
MRVFPIVLLCIIFSYAVSAQSLRYNVSMPYISMGAYSSNQNDPFAFTGNQAALAKTTSAGVGLWAERRFMLTEISVYSAAAAIPTRMGNVGVQINYSGFKNFNDNKVGLAYARTLGKAIDIGAQFNYYSYRIPQYGSASAINFEIGAIMHFSDKFHGGIHSYSPVGGKLGKFEDEKLASVYKLGLGYDASDNFYISSEIIKEEDKSVSVVGAIQYQFMKQFFARAGFVSETGSAYGGAGVSWKNMRLDISANYHPQLGFSPGLLFIANFKKN